MRKPPVILSAVIALVCLGLTLLPAANPANAQSGTVIHSAVLSIFETSISGQTVNVHPITSTWTETGVTWKNFGNSFDSTPLGSFTANSLGWHTLTVTSQVQAWVDNPTQNYGLLLEQGITPYTSYDSSEFGLVTKRPKLDVCYSRNGAPQTCVTIQRLGTEQGHVADAYIWESSPDYNGGTSSALYTGWWGGGTKYVLLRFELTTPTAVQLQSLTARSSMSPELALAVIGTAGALGLVVLGRRRER